VFSRQFWGHCPAEINGADNKQIVFTFRNGSTREFTGRSLLLTFSVPQFFFHLTRPMTSCVIAALISPKRISSACQLKYRRIEPLNLAAVCAASTRWNFPILNDFLEPGIQQS
jgi:hypothetical protein